MSTERILNFILSHNATIIELLFGLTLLLVTFLAVRMFLFSKEGAVSGEALDLSQLENSIKQLIEKAGAVPAGGSGSEDSQRLALEISNLKTELEAKQKKIEEMASTSASAASPSAGLSAEEKASLDSKIKELEAKLAEYEIISEDIADLSFYKEQNLKLQKEIEVLKTGAGAAANPAAVAQAVPSAAPQAQVIEEALPPAAVSESKSEPAIVGKSSAPAEVETPVAPTPPPAIDEATPNPTSAAPASEFSVDDDLMAEFAAAVSKQKSTEAAATPGASKPEVKEEKPEASAEPVVDLGQVDIDKMIAESQEIKADTPDVDLETALGKSVDENRLLKEAEAMNVSSEDKKLMGEFENFVKKEGG